MGGAGDGRKMRPVAEEWRGGAKDRVILRCDIRAYVADRRTSVGL